MLQEVGNSYQQKKWDNSIHQVNGSFLHSWEWGVLQEKHGKKVWRVIITNSNIEYPFVMYQEQLPGGFNWIYLPFVYCSNSPVLKLLFEYVKKIAQKERSLFVYTEPVEESIQTKLLEKYGFKLQKDASIQPLDTIILPLDSDEDSLLNQMHKKTRYNIRLSQKKGVRVEIAKDESSREAFFQLIQKTEKRQGIDSHSFDYYNLLLDLDQNYLVTAYIDDVMIAGNILNIYGSNAIYLHGASDYQYRSYMAPYLLQWKSIEFSIEKNCNSYDFWGIQGRSKNTSQWGGISTFKKGFTQGKYLVHYPGLYINIQRKFFYLLYKLFRRFRRFV